MVTKKKTSSKKAEATVSAPEEVKDELVAEAKIDVEIEEEIAPENRCAPDAPLDDFSATDEAVAISSTVTLLNTSYNEILLNTGHPGGTIRIAPKELKSVSRELLRELLQNKIVRRWFDKGILTSNLDANETTTNEAEVPEALKGPVERTDSVSTISAKVTKFKKDGKVSIKL